MQVRYDPFDLREVLIYDPATKTPLESSTANKQRNIRAPSVPEESRKSVPQISKDSIAYFNRLRAKYLENQKTASEVSFDSLRQQPTEEDPRA